MQDHFPPKYIDEIAQIDVNANYFSPVWAELIARTGEFQNMLDIGCGNGIFSAEAKSRTGCALHGVDGSDYALQQAKAIGFESLALIEDFNTSLLPFETGRFDFCLCKDLLEHLMHPEFVMSEAFRVLQKGGFLLAHVPNHFTLHGRLRFLLQNEIDTYGYFPDAKRWEQPHIRFFRYEDLVELGEATGFQTIANLSHHFPAIPLLRFLPFSSEIKAKLIDLWPSQFSEGLTILFKKPDA
ncbi:MAG: methyltransferase domain-containing protein [Betaproteobacteria bacterium]|nr:methyltransferase domain-containing protein [Betaproteobacteria bacterium]